MMSKGRIPICSKRLSNTQEFGDLVKYSVDLTDIYSPQSLKMTNSNSNDKETWSFMIIVGIITNVLSVVGIVICNKYIMEVDGFNFSVFLSFLHFATTSVGTRILLHLGYFMHNTPQLQGVLIVAGGSLLSVAFMNLNLAYNSVGFYQVCLLYGME